jgi:hypothetical protein
MVIEVKEMKQGKCAAISAFGENPEGLAWEKMRNWAKINLKDYEKRQYFGCAPKDQEGEYEYLANVTLREDDIITEEQSGVKIKAIPSGLFVTSDVDYKSADMGGALESAYFQMIDWIKENKAYIIKMENRPVLEEQFFNEKWSSGSEALSGFKLWLPIEKV